MSGLPEVSCIQYVPPLLHDTSGNPDATPSNPRILGVETFYWGGAPWLAANNGNDLVLWDISDPLSPTTRRESNLKAGYCGDRDYNLFNFSLCDDCRYGVAGFPSCTSFNLGAMLFDIGTGSAPLFGDKAQYQTAKGRGALTFKHNGQQYLLINGVPNDSSLEPAALPPPLQRCQLSRPAEALQGPGGRRRLPARRWDLLHHGQPVLRLPVRERPLLRVHIFEVSGSGQNLVLDYKGAPFVAGYVYSKGLRVDAAAGFAAVGRGANLEIWDIADPATPVLLTTWVPEVGRQLTTVAIAYPFLWAAEKGSPHKVWTYDITNPFSPVPLDQAFWDPAEAWNDFGSINEYDAQFGPDGTTLYDGRYSVMEMFDFSACGDVIPVADISLTPQPAFPGDQVKVTNTSVGAWTRAAVWVTLGSNPQGQVVAGSSALSATTPTDLFSPFPSPSASTRPTPPTSRSRTTTTPSPSPPPATSSSRWASRSTARPPSASAPPRRPS